MGSPHPARQLALPNLEAHPITRAALVPVGASNDAGRPAAALASRLTETLGAPLVVAVTDNRRTMLSIRRVAGVRHVRLHHMFADAPAEVLEAVARYLAHGDRRAGAHIDAFIRANHDRIRRDEAAHGGALRAQGAAHDLDEILAELVARYAAGAPPVAITWGRSGASQRRAQHRTIRMGTYLYDARLIRIHPALDQPWVPRYFVAWVVFHELLHHVTPAPEVGGRRCHHTPDFRAREATFHDRDRAVEWERHNVRRLIASRDL